MAVGRRRRFRSRKRDATNIFHAAGDQLICLILNPFGGSGIGRAATRRVVLEAAVFWWIVRRCHHDTVRQSAGSSGVVGEDRVRDYRRRREAVAIVDHHIYFVGSEHLERGGERRLGESVRVDADEKRTIYTLLPAMNADRLSDGEDVLLIERAFQRCSAVPRRTERDTLRDRRGIRLERVVVRHESWDVGEYRFGRGLAGQRTDFHFGIRTGCLS